MNGCRKKSRKSRKSRRSRRAGFSVKDLINQASSGLSRGFDSVKGAATEAQTTVTDAANKAKSAATNATSAARNALPQGGRRRKTLRTRRGGMCSKCGDQSPSGGKRRSRRGGRKTRRH